MNEIFNVGDQAKISNLIEQVTDFWMGRATYDNDQEWLENVGCIIGELCDINGNGTASVVEQVPAPKGAPVECKRCGNPLPHDCCPCCGEMGYDSPEECSACEDGNHSPCPHGAPAEALDKCPKCECDSLEEEPPMSKIRPLHGYKVVECHGCQHEWYEQWNSLGETAPGVLPRVQPPKKED